MQRSVRQAATTSSLDKRESPRSFHLVVRQVGRAGKHVLIQWVDRVGLWNTSIPSTHVSEDPSTTTCSNGTGFDAFGSGSQAVPRLMSVMRSLPNPAPTPMRLNLFSVPALVNNTALRFSLSGRLKNRDFSAFVPHVCCAIGAASAVRPRHDHRPDSDRCDEWSLLAGKPFASRVRRPPTVR
jgi:hypothetical protein